MSACLKENGQIRVHFVTIQMCHVVLYPNNSNRHSDRVLEQIFGQKLLQLL